MDICIIEKDIKEIELIKSLWEQLNSIHFEKSIHFKSKYEKFTFEKRMKSIYEKLQKGSIKLDMVFDNSVGRYVGYCLSSIENNLGEIDSIYIETEYRKFGLGGKLMGNALQWFELNGITNIQISVAYANDKALAFYEHYGFYVGNYVLRRKE